MSWKSTPEVSSPTRTTLALIPYLNCEPFYESIATLGYGIVHEPPRWLGKLAEEGQAACGPMAVADYLRLADRFAPLEHFGIACTGAAKSVLLFSRRPIGELGGARIGLTNESSTSVRLLQVLMGEKYGHRRVQFHRGEDPADDARLVIGDAALRARKSGVPGFEHTADLGAEWHEWTNMPFVFARWVVARDIPQVDRDRIAQSVRASVAGWRARVGEIAARRGPELGMDAAEIEDYLATFTYRLGIPEEDAELRFSELLFAIEDFE